MYKTMRYHSGQFLQYLTYNLTFPMEGQELVRGEKHLWCLDWWIVEVAKCIYETAENYKHYSLPRRLRDNPYFQQNEILEAAEIKLQTIRELRDGDFDRVAVVETMRGLDTILINSIKDWKQIYIYHWSDYPNVCKKTEEYLSKVCNTFLTDMRIIEKVNSVEGDFVAVSPYPASTNQDSFLSKAKKVLDNKGFLVKEVWHD